MGGEEKSCIIDVDVNHYNLATVAFQVVYQTTLKKPQEMRLKNKNKDELIFYAFKNGVLN